MVTGGFRLSLFKEQAGRSTLRGLKVGDMNPDLSLMVPLSPSYEVRIRADPSLDALFGP